MLPSEFYELGLKKGDNIEITYEVHMNKYITKRVELFSETLSPTIVGNNDADYKPPELLYVGDHINGNGIPLFQIIKIAKI